MVHICFICVSFMFFDVLWTQESNTDLFTDVHTLEFDDIKNLPVSNLDEVLMLFPGIHRDCKSIHIWGGNGENEIAYYLDGVLISKPEHINLDGIEKISIQKSGFSAEYGSGYSGIVYITTREPRANSISLSYLTDELLPAEKLNYGFNQYNIYGQGVVKNNFRYSFIGKSLFADAPSNGLYKFPAPENGYNGLLRYVYKFKNEMNTIAISGYTLRDQKMLWHPDIVGGNAYKYSKQQPMNREKVNSVIVTGDFVLGKKTISSIKFTRTLSDSVFGNRDYLWEEENGHRWYDDYRLKGEHLIEYLKRHSLLLREILVDSVIKYHNEADKNSEKALRHNPYGIRGVFYTSGDYPAWCYYKSAVQRLFMKFKHNITYQNEIKCGMDFFWNEFDYYNNPLPWFVQSMWNYYELNPSAISAYLEDCWKTDRIGVLAGLRYSYFNYGLYQPWLVPNSPDQDTITTLKKIYISPRIGILMPVSTHFRIFFNGGEFYYEPAGYLGRFEPGKTRIFEMGSIFELEDEISLKINFYQKYIYDLIIEKLQNYYGHYFPMNYYYSYTYIDRTEVNGIEMNLEWALKQLISIGLNYNLQFASQMPIYGYNYYYDYYYKGNDPITGEPINDEKKYFPIDYDCRHIFKTYLILKTPEGFYTPLNNSTLSLLFSFYSGLPYTPEDFKGEPLGDINSARMSASNNLNMKYLKKFHINFVRLNFMVLINNIFNTRQVVYVYPTTGKPDDHGDPDPSIGQFGWLSIASLSYSPQTDFNHDGL
ncbi:MAG: TonB-dependent receptor plug domain-containing protein [bacterium]